MNSSRALDVAILSAATALTRFAFRSHYLYDIDSVNFALALVHFDPSVHQPHPPGYFLYVCLGRLFRLIFHDANSALVAMSIVFSCGAAAMIYVLAANWFGRHAGVFAGLVFLFSPLAWFHGTVALTYIVETFFSALAGYVCWRIENGMIGYIVPGAIVVGVSAGFRPSSLLLLFPLLLFSYRRATRKQIAAGCTALILTLLAWTIPMIHNSGGSAYLSSLLSLWLTVPSQGTFFNSSPLNSFVRACIIAGIYLLGFGCAALLPAWGLRRGSTDRRVTAFTLAWIAPGLLFFTFVYLKFINSGYLLALFPPICAYIGNWAAVWYTKLPSGRALKALAVGGCAAVNALIFIYAPLYCSYSSVRQFESELASVIRILPRIASPRDTVIVGLDSHFLGYRHAGYYLPVYLTVQFPAVGLTSGTRMFTMRNQDTVLESHLATASFRNFIIFPLPSGDREYTDYMTTLQKRFPSGELRSIIYSGHEFKVAPIADLRFLFPVSVSSSGSLVHE